MLAWYAERPGLTPALHNPGVGAPVILPLRGGDKGVQGHLWLQRESNQSGLKTVEKKKRPKFELK